MNTIAQNNGWDHKCLFWFVEPWNFHHCPPPLNGLVAMGPWTYLFAMVWVKLICTLYLVAAPPGKSAKVKIHTQHQFGCNHWYQVLLVPGTDATPNALENGISQITSKELHDHQMWCLVWIKYCEIFCHFVTFVKAPFQQLTTSWQTVSFLTSLYCLCSHF